MTKQEKIIVSAYTGTLMYDFGDVHEYIERKLGRPVYTHELVDKNIWKEIEEKSKEDFLEICKQEEQEQKTGKWTKETKHYKDQFQEFNYYTIKCSVCGSAPEKNWHLTNYCPNCGAYMRGEEDD